jgi:hypothetical protein
MKKIFVSLSLMLTVGSTTVLANDEPVSDKVNESFKKEFVGARLVEWNHVGDYQMASFVFDGHRVEAYFNTDGELEGSARDILFDQLPLLVMRSFEKRFASAEVIDILEVSNIEGTSYLIKVETQNKRFLVKVGTNGDFLKVDKIKK